MFRNLFRYFFIPHLTHYFFVHTNVGQHFHTNQNLVLIAPIVQTANLHWKLMASRVFLNIVRNNFEHIETNQVVPNGA